MRLLAILLAFLNVSCVAQQTVDWKQLLEQGKVDETEVLCASRTRAASLEVRVDAEKCLANVDLAIGSVASLQGNDVGGGSLGPGYRPEAIDKAIAHLNRGIELTPQDLSLHQGRLYVLEAGQRFEEMDRAVAASAAVYKGADALQAWITYDAQLVDAGHLHAALSFAETLDQLYPNSNQVIGNLSAIHSMLKEFDKALPYAVRAQALAPDNALDTWNLGWTYSNLNDIPNADKWLSKAVRMDAKGEDLHDRECLYAQFVETKLNDRKRGCTLERQNCEASGQTACQVLSPAASQATPSKPR